MAEDVNADGVVSPIDGLILVNLLNQDALAAEGEGSGSGSLFYDPTGDGVLSPADVLRVFNYLNRIPLGEAPPENDTTIASQPIAPSTDVASVAPPSPDTLPFTSTDENELDSNAVDQVLNEWDGQIDLLDALLL